MEEKFVPKVLVVDDQPSMLKLALWTMEELWPEAKIETAKDGRQAALKLFELRPDLVVTDICMPGLNGVELCSVIKENPFLLKNTKVIAVTGYHDPEINEQALLCGADEYLVKPYRSEDLRKSATRLLGIPPFVWDSKSSGVRSSSGRRHS